MNNLDELTIWHVDIDTTGAALQRFARALLQTGASLLPSRLIMGPLGRGTSALLMIQVKRSQVDNFRDICKPIRIAPPFPVDVA